MTSMEDAQIALLALGRVLKSESMPSAINLPTGVVLESARLETSEHYQKYEIRANPNYSPPVKVEVLYWLPGEYVNQKGLRPRGLTPRGEFATSEDRYPSIAEAKAACEIHAATGAFPPSVEPELLNVEHQPPGAPGAA